MSKGINKVILIGVLGKDPEVRYIPNGKAVASFSIATSESWTDNNGAKQEKTEWHNCVAWGKAGELIGEYCKKGSRIYIEGKLKTEKWQDQSGSDRYTTKINVNNFQFLSSNNSGGSGSNNSNSDNPSKGEPDMDFDDGIPF